MYLPSLASLGLQSRERMDNSTWFNLYSLSGYTWQPPSDLVKKEEQVLYYLGSFTFEITINPNDTTK